MPPAMVRILKTSLEAKADHRDNTVTRHVKSGNSVIFQCGARQQQSYIEEESRINLIALALRDITSLHSGQLPYDER